MKRTTALWGAFVCQLTLVGYLCWLMGYRMGAGQPVYQPSFHWVPDGPSEWFAVIACFVSGVFSVALIRAKR